MVQSKVLQHRKRISTPNKLRYKRQKEKNRNEINQFSVRVERINKNTNVSDDINVPDDNICCNSKTKEILYDYAVTETTNAVLDSKKLYFASPTVKKNTNEDLNTKEETLKNEFNPPRTTISPFQKNEKVLYASPYLPTPDTPREYSEDRGYTSLKTTEKTSSNKLLSLKTYRHSLEHAKFLQVQFIPPKSNRLRVVL